MKKELLKQYLERNSTINYGIYLVGWFLGGKWDDSDYREKATKKLGWDHEQARQFFENQAYDLSDDINKIEAFVMDTSLKSK